MNEKYWSNLANSILTATAQTTRYADGHAVIQAEDELRRTTGFAGWKHEGQLRKGAGDIPYIHHPVEVTAILTEVGSIDDLELLQAALLHDTIEDTATSRKEIESLFGERVCSIVLEVTDDKTLEKKKRKAAQIAHAPHLSPEAQCLKLADKISNVYDLAFKPPVNWEAQRQLEYFDWAEKVVAGLRGCNNALEELFAQQVMRSREAVTSTSPLPPVCSH